MATVVSDQKLRGGYYTPSAVASFLAAWAIERPGATVLEPSAGDGNIATAAAERLLALGADPREVSDRMMAVELYDEEAAKAASRLRGLGIGIADSPVVTSDFFQWAQDALSQPRRYDVALGNPPFVRYQHFPETQRERGFALMREVGMSPSRLTNLWVPFVVAATRLLSDTGRLAMVIPAELLQVGYTAQLRKYLTDQYKTITVVTFRKLLFPGTQQEVVLLLASRQAKGREGIDVVELDDDHDLETIDWQAHDERALKPVEHSTEKWTQYYLSAEEILLLRRLAHDERVGRFLDWGHVDVGVVTGRNQFFLMGAAAAAARGLTDLTIPIVGRTVQTPGVIYGPDDVSRDDANGLPCHLLDVRGDARTNPSPDLLAYAAEGEKEGIHLGYKCSIRTPWWTVPSVWTPDAFMFRQINRYPKMVLNKTAATSTDTIHRVRFREGIDREAATVAYHTSLVFAFSEIVGRSYGGGVLELEPNEADHLPVPPLGKEKLDLDEIDCLARLGRVDDILAITDAVYLRRGLGLPDTEIETLRGAWRKLSDRRTNRKAKERRALA